MGLLRAFISIDFPERIKEEIKKIQKKLPKFEGKLTEKENLHLTLKFLGYADEKKIDETKKQLRKIKSKGFLAEIGKIGFFYPRIVWLHLTGCSELQKNIDENLSGLFEKERRFMGHITIARIKSVNDWEKFKQRLNMIKTEKANFNVTNFRLKKSTLTKKGPIYETIEEYKLK